MPARSDVRIQLIAPHEFQATLDAWRAKNGSLSRSEAIRLLVKRGLACGCGDTHPTPPSSKLDTSMVPFAGSLPRTTVTAPAKRRWKA